MPVLSYGPCDGCMDTCVLQCGTPGQLWGISSPVAAWADKPVTESSPRPARLYLPELIPSPAPILSSTPNLLKSHFCAEKRKKSGEAGVGCG